ncbi:uncharacterized protein LOC133839654 [Drosophila sulfurigaster albostrigata]|uniref:uncharacterized protein LOC133839654 n=1 Tax=Drosophila sulfurigaster albostrigata TaxID=89887 RepID=UPI002D21C65F|nr:uncharacterized protein LOC133839654 [Drosophila sulfurigaster albostrigata]
MLRPKGNNNTSTTTTTTATKHVKLPQTFDDAATLHHQHQHQLQQHRLATVQALQLRLDYNQHLNQRVTLCLELYHKNIIKKLSELNKINVYKLS